MKKHYLFLVLLAVIITVFFGTMCVNQDTPDWELEESDSVGLQQPSIPAAKDPKSVSNHSRMNIFPGDDSDDRMFFSTDREVIPDPLEKVINDPSKEVEEKDKKPGVKESPEVSM